MGTVRYTVIDGEVVSELRGGVKRDYLPDPLGSTVALLDSSQSKTDTFEYWPYGETTTRTGTTATPFQYVGTMGYYNDGNARSYIRARYLDKEKGRWTTEDPAMDGFNYCMYVSANPQTYVDILGLYKFVSCNKNQISVIMASVNELCKSTTISDFDSCLDKGCSCKSYLDLILGGGDGFPSDCASSKCNNKDLTFTCTNKNNKFFQIKKKGKVVCAAWNPVFVSPNNIFLCEGFFSKKCDPKGCYIAHEMIHGCGQGGHSPACFNCVTQTFPGCNNSYGGVLK